MSFEPIAIVGRACVLPGSPDPGALWNAVAAGHDLLGTVPADRWGAPRCDVMGSVDKATDRTWCDRGGYVRDFEFEAEGYAIPAADLVGLDPLFHWLLQAGRGALADISPDDRATTGAIIGNLSFPTVGMVQFAQRTWLGDALADAANLPKVDPRNRFMSGLPAHLMAHALGLGRPAFCLDAACASSLVAIKLACDRLQRHEADTMLAGGVCRADDLFIHVGFCALQAMSRIAMSRPFHQQADGLVPAEGAGIVTLERLADARRKGRRIMGVIRGVGLSNDGRGKGFLAPDVEGQVRAMRAAYAQADLSPDCIDYVECHATGTSVGDSTELRSLARVFGQRSDDQKLPIGSLKSNLGHLITAAGVAGLLKVLSAMESETLPPTIHLADQPLTDELQNTSLRVVTQPEPWRTTGVRRAAVSAFGFGGNNAHLIVEQHDPNSSVRALVPANTSHREPIAVVALSIVRPEDGKVAVDAGVRFPPRDLEQALPQQLLMLNAAGLALQQVEGIDPSATGTLIGMGCDPAVARHGARWRTPSWARRWQVREAGWIRDAQDAFVGELQSAGVLGTMPNIVANRLNSAFDLRGPSMSVSAEELSGVRALEIGCHALQSGEMDAVLVGAVDLSCEPVHGAALAGLGMDRPRDDAAVALVLERVADAERLGHRILATVAPTSTSSAEPSGALAGAHAAIGLLAIANCIEDGAATTLHLWALGNQRASIEVVPKAQPPARPPQPGTASAMPTFRAHRPAVDLPPFPATSPQPGTVAPLSVREASMPMAPWLQPMTEPTPFVALPAEPPTAPVARAAPALGVALATPSGRIAPHGAALAMTQHHHFVAQQHSRFLAQQMDLHQQFLAMSRRSQERCLQALASVPTETTSAPTAPPRAAPPWPTPANRQHANRPAEPVTPAVAPAAPPAPIGLSLDRAGLEVHAGGRISEVFGAALAAQDSFHRQVRMPQPPLLLADRMTGIDAELAVMGRGTIWTETDVNSDSWYLHHGRMPAGLMIESGQADLMLISYMGVDLLNKSDRVYRLLGCELSYHGPLPQPGDTLCYDIHVDGHANQGDQRLFFFHYDCHINGELRLSVRSGQAGFFTDEELADSAGVLWDAATAKPCDNPRLDRTPCTSQHRSFSGDQLRAFAAGDAHACFGPGFELAQTHTRTPAIAAGRMLWLDEVTEFAPEGGPWGRGYLRAVDAIEADDWFFDGHFKNDPCMPGTLMFEGCLQAMAVYLTALGFTLERDGWRFEPVDNERYTMRCRGQVLPSSKELVYEVFIAEIVDGPTPTIYADLLCTVDGLKAFHCRGLGLRLVPDWPLDEQLQRMPELAIAAPGAVASVDGFAFGYDSLLACAWGKPSRAFGPIYQVFDTHRRVARLPGPPYHFMTRVEAIDGEIGALRADQSIEVAYDVPHDAWYFADNGARTMPYCVLLEAALQPCGWLASFVGSALSSETDLCFRNLDGTCTQHVEVLPDAGTLRTRSRLTTVSATAEMIIESFEVACFVGELLVYDMKTVFGFFPAEAFDNQVGLPVPAAEKGALDASCNVPPVDLTLRPAAYFGGDARLPAAALTMIDRVTGVWPEGGAHRLGRYRAEKDVDPGEWFFKAHFFQDPVQPGSLGIEAMIQLLQFAMLERGMGIPDGQFEPLALRRPLTWKYRGQVRPEDGIISTLLDISEVGSDEQGPYMVADASLWVDGKRIYQASNVGMRIVPRSREQLLDPERDAWLRDHCPTFTVPALPMMSMVDRLAAAVTNVSRQQVIGMKRVDVKRWLPLPGPVRVDTKVTGDGPYDVTLLAWRSSAREELSRFEPVATAEVLVAAAFPSPPEPFSALEDASEAALPYASGALFHGPAFHKLHRLWMGRSGASALLDANPGDVPHGSLNQVLLDAATHAIPHDQLSRWCSDVGDDVVAYPYRIEDLELFGPAPTEGEVRCEVRFRGVADRLCRFAIQLIADGHVWLACDLIEILMPKGPLGSAPPAQRRAFLRDRKPVTGMSLSRTTAKATRLSAFEIRSSNWLPGTLEQAYRVAASDDLVESIAVKEHVGRLADVHPSQVVTHPGSAVANRQPLTRWHLDITRDGEDVVVRGATQQPDLAPVRRYWSEHFACGRWPVEDLYYGLIERFVRDVHLDDPEAFEAIRGKSVLYLANHQVAIESLLFSIIASGLSGVPTVTLAKEEHRTTWLGSLIKHCFAYPGIVDPNVITYFDRSNPESLANIIAELAAEMTGPGKSVMVHVEGTRSLSCREPVRKMTSAFVDMALATRAHIVPVRFVGGLPVEPLDQRIEFPIGMGQQDIYLGRPIPPEAFEALPYKDRKALVLNALNALGPDNAREQPCPGNAEFAAEVLAHAKARGVSEEHAALQRTLSHIASPSESVQRLLAGSIAGNEAEDGWLAELRRRLYGAGS